MANLLSRSGGRCLLSRPNFGSAIYEFNDSDDGPRVSDIFVELPLVTTHGTTPTITINLATEETPGVVRLATEEEWMSGDSGGAVVTAESFKQGLDLKANVGVSYTKAETNSLLNAKAPLTGAGTSGTWPISITGSSVTSSKLTTPRIISISGDAVGAGAGFDGSANISINVALAPSGVIPGSYNFGGLNMTPFTVDGKGRITAVGQSVPTRVLWENVLNTPTTLDGYGMGSIVIDGGDF